MGECLPDKDIEALATGAELSPSDELRAKTHLDACAACRAKVDQFGWQADAGEKDDRGSPKPSSAAPTMLAGENGAGPAEGLPRSAPPKIPGYDITRCISDTGTQGTIFLGRQQSLDREVAIKVLRTRVHQVQPSLLERFKREAKVLAKLRHPQVVQVIDHGEVGDAAYYVMEYIEGTPLDELIMRMAASSAHRLSEKELVALIDHNVTVPPARGVHGAVAGAGEAGEHAPYYRLVAHWIAEMAEALYEIHQRGVIHRDIKPANLILRSEGGLMIMDFGIAKDLTDQSSTMDGRSIGTPFYMSPEQARGEKVDFRTDVFSVGTLLYELLTHTKAFPGENVNEVIRRVQADSPVPPHELVSSVPRELDRICRKAMQKNVGDRYESCKELAAALQAWLAARTPAPLPPVSSVPTNPQSRESAAVRRQSPIALSRPPVRKPRKRLIGLMAVLAVGAVAVLLLGYGRRQPEPSGAQLGGQPVTKGAGAVVPETRKPTVVVVIYEKRDIDEKARAAPGAFCQNALSRIMAGAENNYTIAGGGLQLAESQREMLKMLRAFNRDAEDRAIDLLIWGEAKAEYLNERSDGFHNWNLSLQVVALDMAGGTLGSFHDSMPGRTTNAKQYYKDDQFKTLVKSAATELVGGITTGWKPPA